MLAQAIHLLRMGHALDIEHVVHVGHLEVEVDFIRVVFEAGVLGLRPEAVVVADVHLFDSSRVSIQLAVNRVQRKLPTQLLDRDSRLWALHVGVAVDLRDQPSRHTASHEVLLKVSDCRSLFTLQIDLVLLKTNVALGVWVDLPGVVYLILGRNNCFLVHVLWLMGLPPFLAHSSHSHLSCACKQPTNVCPTDRRPRSASRIGGGAVHLQIFFALSLL